LIGNGLDLAEAALQMPKLSRGHSLGRFQS
jgi:hypothetical protein